MAGASVQLKRIIKTLAVDTAAFATGDQVGALQQVDNILDDGRLGSVLTMVNIIDLAKQSLALDIVFYDRPVALVGAENAPADVSDANVLLAYLGHVSIVAGDYVILNANSMATKACRIPLLNKGSGSSDRAPPVIPASRVYFQVVARGAPTYGAADLSVVLVTETQS